jgi:hypothetical protein
VLEDIEKGEQSEKKLESKYCRKKEEYGDILSLTHIKLKLCLNENRVGEKKEWSEEKEIDDKKEWSEDKKGGEEGERER